MARFLIDVDGVVAQCAELMIEEINKRFRTTYERVGVAGYNHMNQLKFSDITDFDFMNPEKGILTPGECKFALENFARAQFAYDMHPYPMAKSVIRDIRGTGHDVVFVTAQWGRSIDWCHSRTRWLEQHFDTDPKDIIFTHRKELVDGDVLIEDKGSTCVNYALTHPTRDVLMMNQPWNVSEYKSPKNVTRIFGWKNLSEISKGKLWEF